MMYKNTSKMMLKIVNFWLKKFFFASLCLRKKKTAVFPAVTRLTVSDLILCPCGIGRYILFKKKKKRLQDYSPRVQFYNSLGEVVTMSYAYTTGLRADLKSNRLRGVQQCDASGNKIGHVVPVCIDNIRMFNNQKVVL